MQTMRDRNVRARVGFVGAVSLRRHWNTNHWTPTAASSKQAWRCATPGFRTKDTDDGPKASFFPEAPKTNVPLTPNERARAKVQETMRELGVSMKEPAPPPASYVPIDISRVNPFSALAGSFGAAIICYAAWTVLQGTVSFYMTHPFQADFYVVRRINAIIRTVLVGIFALGSGISGVTALGLFLLAGRTGIAAVTGEFKDGKENEPKTSTKDQAE